MQNIDNLTVQQVVECLCGYAVRGYVQQCRCKYVVDETESTAVECCYQLLKNLNIEHPIGQILVEAVSSFHNKHGCSVRLLLCMTFTWYRAYNTLIRQGCSRRESLESFDKLLDVSISIINSLSTSLKQRPRQGSEQSSSKSQTSLGTSLVTSSQTTASLSSQTKISLSSQTTVSLSSEVKAVDNHFDDVSWFFEPDDALPATTSDSINISSVPTLVSARKSASHTHSDDDDFEDCFDFIEQIEVGEQKVRHASDIASSTCTQFLSPPSETVSTPTAVTTPATVSTPTTVNISKLAVTQRTVTTSVTVSAPTVTNTLLTKPAVPQTTVTTTPLPTGSTTSSVEWLNVALASVRSKSANSNSNTSQTSSKMYSRNLQTDLSPDTNTSIAQYSETVNKVVEQPFPFTSQSTKTSGVYVDDIIEGLCRHDDVVERLLRRVVDLNESSDYSAVSRSCLNNVNTVSCVGVVSSLSEVCPGMVVSCDGEVFNALSRCSTAVFRTLLFQGDLHPNYTHTGYKKTVDFKQVLKAKDISTNMNSRGWCDSTLDLVIQNGSRCLLMKGYCEPTLKQNLLGRGVIVLENTSYSILSYISQSTDTPIIHYPDVSSLVFNCELKLSPLYKNASHLVNIELNIDQSSVSTPMLTAILCSPSKDSSFILEERFKHAMSRLKSIVVSGRCLVNVSLRDIVNHLHLHTDLWRCGDVMLQASTRIFIEELSSLAMSTQSSHDIQLVNDVTTTISAWETALSVCKYISSVSVLVKVGEKTPSSVNNT